METEPGPDAADGGSSHHPDQSGHTVPTANGSAAAASPGPASPGTVTVTGSGTAEAAPDLMVVSIGVECRAESVQDAFARAGAGSAAVTAAFRRHGVAGPDIRTAGLNVRADLVWREGEGQKVTGYVAAATLTVRLRALGPAAAAISEAVDAGGNDVRLNGLDLTFSDDAAVRARAREAAWLDALAVASQYAHLASSRLGQGAVRGRKRSRPNSRTAAPHAARRRRRKPCRGGRRIKGRGVHHCGVGARGRLLGGLSNARGHQPALTGVRTYLRIEA